MTTWEASGIYVGCWTPLCEHWFQKRLQSIRAHAGGTYTSTQWGKNLRYAKETKKFFVNAKKVGQDFMVESCEIRNV